MARELTVWKPFREMVPFDFERMRREMDRLWDSFFERSRRTGADGEYFPVLDICETKDQILVNADVPGMEPKDLDVTLSDNILTLKGEKKHIGGEEGASCHLVERSYGSFSRSIQLPTAVQGNKINASYKNGVLQIILPKSEEAKTREVKIQVK